jgi:O-antigen ligase
MALSSFWAIEPEDALSRAFKFLLITWPGYFLYFALKRIIFPENTRDAFFKTLAVFFFIALAAIVFEYLNGFLLTRYIRGALFEIDTIGASLNRSSILLVMFLLPVLFGLKNLFGMHSKKFWGATAILICLILCVFFTTISQTAQIALIFSFLMFGIFYYLPQKFYKLASITAIILVFFAPWIIKPLYTWMPEKHEDVHPIIWEASIPHRLANWNFIISKIEEKPLIGHGIEATQYFKV